MKRCEDCKHCMPLPQIYIMWFIPMLSTKFRKDFGLCKLFPTEPETSVVTGAVIPPSHPFKFCTTIRNHDCGKEARLFEPKEIW